MIATRKPNRIKDFDYKKPGMYFVTFWTEGRRCILANIKHSNPDIPIQSPATSPQNMDLDAHYPGFVGETIGLPPYTTLTAIGEMTDQAIRNIPILHPMITIEQYVVMPNHVHILLQIHAEVDGRPMVSPTINVLIGQLKGYVTKQVGKCIWQKSFYDHVVRNRQEYRDICKYIYENPASWYYDSLYSEN